MSNYTQTRDIYLALVDGGNSTNVKGRVENISLSQALTLYQDLLALSPNLSEEVMAKLVQKEQEFPATLLTMILASNPSAVKSAMIQKALSERNTPLNSYQMGLIATGWNGSSPKELLESEMLHYRLEISKRRFRLAQDLAKTESSGNHLQTLLGGYFENDFLADRLVKADLLMRYGSFASGMDMLLSSESHFDLEDSEKDGIALYAHLLEIEHAILTRQDQTLSQTETSELLAIASSEPCGYGKRAYHLLVCYGGYDDVEVNCDQSDELLKRLSQIASSTGLSKEKSGLIAYPNPVKGEILVVKFDRYIYDVNKVAVYSLDGKLQYEMKIESGSTEIILPAMQLINGPNQVCLFSNAGILLDSVIIFNN